MLKCNDTWTASTASRYHRLERDDFAKECIMFDIFCCCLFCFFHISFSRSSRFLVFTVAVVVVTAAIKLMAYVCTFIYWVLYAFQSHQNESNRQWRFGTKKNEKEKNERGCNILEHVFMRFRWVWTLTILLHRKHYSTWSVLDSFLSWFGLL